MANEVEITVTSKDKTNFKSASAGAKEYGSSINKVGEHADNSESKLIGLHDTVDGVSTIMQGPGQAGIAGYIQGWADLAGGVATFVAPATAAVTAIIRNGVATTIATVQQKAAAAATKAWAAVQWLLNAALDANPIGIIIIAIAALVAGIILAYKHSETFRNIVHALGKVFTTVFSWIVDGIKKVVGFVKDHFPQIATVFKFVALAVIMGARIMLNAILSFVEMTLKVMGKLPGPLGAPFRKAADSVENFKNKANTALDKAEAKVKSFGRSVTKIPGSKNVVIRVIDHATGTLQTVQREVDALTGRAIAIQVGRVGIGPRAEAHGGIVGAATGGIRSRLTMVGEHGPELVDLAPGSSVRSNPDTRRLMAQTGGRAVVLEIRSGGSRLDDLLVETLRKAIRINAGGNVQLALGS